MNKTNFVAGLTTFLDEKINFEYKEDLSSKISLATLDNLYSSIMNGEFNKFVPDNYNELSNKLQTAIRENMYKRFFHALNLPILMK